MMPVAVNCNRLFPILTPVGSLLAVTQLREKARYIRVSPAGMREAAPHDGGGIEDGELKKSSGFQHVAVRLMVAIPTAQGFVAGVGKQIC